MNFSHSFLLKRLFPILIHSFLMHWESGKIQKEVAHLPSTHTPSAPLALQMHPSASPPLPTLPPTLSQPSASPAPSWITSRGLSSWPRETTFSFQKQFSLSCFFHFSLLPGTFPLEHKYHFSHLKTKQKTLPLPHIPISCPISQLFYNKILQKCCLSSRFPVLSFSFIPELVLVIKLLPLETVSQCWWCLHPYISSAPSSPYLPFSELFTKQTMLFLQTLYLPSRVPPSLAPFPQELLLLRCLCWTYLIFLNSVRDPGFSHQIFSLLSTLITP